MLKKIFNKSKWLHNYIGLIFIIFLILECISGIILNHPGLFAGINVPSFIVPLYREGGYDVKEISLVKLFFDLLGGKAWGLAGKLIVDN